jgi:hypothetical protein
MAIAASNPLFKHFRQPAIYLKLPSRGTYWPENSIDLPESAEIPVYPMTVKDEITLKTPDALMNGVGVANMITSCCPNIHDPYAIPSIDLDAILIAIRLASYGPKMGIETTCPHCNQSNEHNVDLSRLLDNLKQPKFDQVNVENLTFRFKPQSFRAINDANIISYEQQRLIQTITNSSLSEEEKKKQFELIFPRLTDLNIMAIVNSIESITTQDTQVTDSGYIKEFVTNCDRKVYQQIKELITQQANLNKLDPIEIVCDLCNDRYKSEIEFEQANFFG